MGNSKYVNINWPNSCFVCDVGKGVCVSFFFMGMQVCASPSVGYSHAYNVHVPSVSTGEPMCMGGTDVCGIKYLVCLFYYNQTPLKLYMYIIHIMGTSLLWTPLEPMVQIIFNSFFFRVSQGGCTVLCMGCNILYESIDLCWTHTWTCSRIYAFPLQPHPDNRPSMIDLHVHMYMYMYA